VQLTGEVVADVRRAVVVAQREAAGGVCREGAKRSRTASVTGTSAAKRSPLSLAWAHGSRVRTRVRAVRDAFFFLSVAGLALSVAGFAGLVSAFRGRDQGWTRTELWRLRMIARLSFLLVFLALVPFPLYALSGDEALVIRIASALIVIAHLHGMVEPRFDPSNWPGRSWLPNAIAHSFSIALSVVNLAAAQTGLLEIALLLRLVHPINLFLLVLRSFEPPVVDS
jgi:uncharacterized membrane protein HdeD (DUF308 family)